MNRPVGWLLAVVVMAMVFWAWRQVSVPGEVGSHVPGVLAGGSEDSDIEGADMLEACGRHTEAIAQVLGERSSSPAKVELGSPQRVFDPQLDDEWLKLPRTRTTLASFVAGAGISSLKSKWMLRNRHLNPRDVYIPPDLRRDLETILEVIGPKLQDGFSSRMAVYMRGLGRAIKEGKAKDIGAPLRKKKVMPDGEEKEVLIVPAASLKAAGVDMYAIRNGQALTASRKDSALSRAALDQEYFLEMEMAASLLKWFRSAGALERAEVDALIVTVVRR